MSASVGNELSHHALPVQRFSRVEISSELCNCSQSDCLRDNRDVHTETYREWLGLACETTICPTV